MNHPEHVLNKIMYR